MMSVGIDIGEFSIKIAEVEDLSGSLAVRRLEEFPLSQDPNKDRKLEVVDTLRRYLDMRDDLIGANFVLSLPEWKVSTRRKFFPFKERHKILKSLPFELEDDIPFSQEDSVFDAKITNYLGNAAQVLAVACPEETVEAQVQLAKDIGVELAILSVDSVALCNLVSPWYQPPPTVSPDSSNMDSDSDELDEMTTATVVSPAKDKVQMLLNIGHANSIAIFFKDGIIKSVRSIDWGGEQLGAVVAENYSMHYIEALKEVQNKGFLLNSPDGASKDQVRFSDTLKSALKGLAQKAQLAILEAETEFNAEISTAYLSGGVSQLKNVGPYLTQCLEIPVNQFHFMNQFAHSGAEAKPGLEAKFSQSLSIAIEGLKKPRNPALNLLKGRFAKEGEGFKPIWAKWGHAIRVGAAALVFLFVWGSVRFDSAKVMADEAHFEMKTLAQSVAGLSRRDSGSTSKIQKFIRAQDKVERSRKSALQVKNINSAMTIMEQISASLPRSSRLPIDIKTIQIDTINVTIAGEVNDQRTMNDIQNALKKVSRNGKVTKKAPIGQVTPGKRAFTFEFQVERKTAGL